MKYLPDIAWNDFKKQHISGDVCDIAQGLITTLIILVPKLHIETFRNSSKYHELKINYYNLLHQHTDIKISKPDSIIIHVESKEDFDAKYKGSWYNYFR